MRRILRVLCLIMALVSLGKQGFAQDGPFPFDPTTPAPVVAEGIEQAVVGRYWQLGRPRPFLAWTAELGYPYLRPRFTTGYGQPYWKWLGVEAYPLISRAGWGSYFGLGGAMPGVTFRLGGRYFFSFERTLLSPRESFTRQDLALVQGPRSEYVTWEAELALTQPLWVGSVYALLTGYKTALTEEPFFLYEETLRVVIDPPYVWRGRVGYLLSLGFNGALRVGPTAEVIGLPQREEYVIRGGVVGSVSINAHLEAQASFVPVLSSPDRLGLLGGDFGQLGVRYRWATQSTPDPARVRAYRLRQANQRQANQRQGSQR